jgi:hypothetical protein
MATLLLRHRAKIIPGLLFATAADLSAAALFASADFQDLTTQGWGAGAPHPAPPVVTQNAGPAGAGDHRLSIFSNGSAGPGGRLAVFSEAGDWTGDYTAAGITGVSVDLRNIGGGTLSIRLGIDGPGGRYSSDVAVALPTPSLWTPVTFSLRPEDLVHVTGTGTGIAEDTLAAVSQIRFIHNPSPDFRAIRAPGSFALDNIVAVPEPSAGILFLFAVAVTLKRRRCSNHVNSP